MMSFLCFISVKKEEFEDTKGIIRIRKSNGVQSDYNGKSDNIMESHPLEWKNNVIII